MEPGNECIEKGVAEFAEGYVEKSIEVVDPIVIKDPSASMTGADLSQKMKNKEGEKDETTQDEEHTLLSPEHRLFLQHLKRWMQEN